MRIYIKRRYGGRGCTAELSIDFYLVNSEESCGKVRKFEKDKIKGKKDYNNRIEQEQMDHLRSMKLNGQFERNTGDKKSWH